ncbi:MAG TPA: phosphomannomutase/phosphoglucomutase, partial [Anaeromyxobacteraceae bacterium]|nr:phosphomannomutase/phosphoglucomutase [Anaeromyxobacteraceae bacterium]
VDRDLTEHAVHQIGRGLGSMVRAAGGSKVVVGRDCRLSGDRFAIAAISGITSAGPAVVDLGVVPTPLVYFAAHTLEVDGHCVITASHNPPEYNGLKVGLRRSALHGEEIQALRRIVEEGRFATGRGASQVCDIAPDYQKFVRENLRLGSRALRVVIDAGNGTGGAVAVPLLQSLGIEVVPLFVEMDGNFPNHHPDPTVETNLEQLRRTVREVKADVGIAYDGDADRVSAVDDQGNIRWGDELLILFSRALLEEHPGAAVVAEVKCSMNLYQDIARRGGRPIMWKAGHSLIRAKMREEGALLGGEMSGHIFFANRWFGFDDGIYASARLLELLSRTDASLCALLADVPKTFATPEIRVDCPEEKKFEVVRRAQAWFSTRYEVITVDGVRVAFPDGWGLVRASNTQPLLIMRFEAASEERLAAISGLVTEKVGELKREVGA